MELDYYDLVAIPDNNLEDCKANVDELRGRAQGGHAGGETVGTTSQVNCRTVNWWSR